VLHCSAGGALAEDCDLTVLACDSCTPSESHAHRLLGSLGALRLALLASEVLGAAELAASVTEFFVRAPRVNMADD